MYLHTSEKFSSSLDDNYFSQYLEISIFPFSKREVINEKFPNYQNNLPSIPNKN